MIGLAAAGCFAACDNSPTRPTPGPTTGPPPLPPVGPVIVRVEILGPPAVAPGETARFSLVAHLTDGSGRDLTNEAIWSSYPGYEQLVSIAGPGLVTGRERGDAYISAAFERHFVVKEVIVVPAGTYRLAGLVREAGIPTGPVVGARVEVTTGGGAGLTTYTDLWGKFRLYGVSGETSLRVTKDGYQPVVRTVVLGDHQTFDIEVPLPAPRADVSGIYTLTITAADHCGVGLGDRHVPEEARVRTYTAAVGQDGPQLAVRLSGATFHALSSFFGGRVEPGRVVFDFTWYDGEQPTVIEQLLTSRFLVLDGSVVAAVSANRLAGMFSGSFRIYETAWVWGGMMASCHSQRHQFVLSR